MNTESRVYCNGTEIPSEARLVGCEHGCVPKESCFECGGHMDAEIRAALAFHLRQIREATVKIQSLLRVLNGDRG